MNGGDCMSEWKHMEELINQLEIEEPQILERDFIHAGSQDRKLNLPHTQTSDGLVRGEWKESSFIFDDDFIPKNFNDKQLTISEIKTELNEKYHLTLDEIPFINGTADFSHLSVASISTDEIVNISDNAEYTMLDKTKDYQNVLSQDQRSINFDLADEIASKKQISILGLKEGYSKEDLSNWRKENHFSWDEQLNGYFLVPSVIHGNLSHTGAVSISQNAYKHITNRQQYLKDHPMEEKDAIISMDEIHRRRNKKMKHGSDKKLGGSLNNLKKELDEGFNLGEKKLDFGKKFELDKAKLEDAMARVEASSVSDEDKESMLQELSNALHALEEQYDRDIFEEMMNTKKTIDSSIQQMNASINELNEQQDSLKDITMEAASVDAKAAADEAEKKKREFEDAKNEAVEKLRLQMEKAEMQQRNIRMNRIKKGS